MRWIPTNKKLKHFDKLWRIMTDENFDECTFTELAFKFSLRSPVAVRNQQIAEEISIMFTFISLKVINLLLISLLPFQIALSP